MKRTEIVREGASRLVRTETAIENAVCEVADLISHLGRTRMDARIALEVGEETMHTLVTTLTALTQARSSISEAHRQLNDVKARLGCSTVALGTGEDKSPPKTKGFHVVHDGRDIA